MNVFINVYWLLNEQHTDIRLQLNMLSNAYILDSPIGIIIGIRIPWVWFKT